MKPNNILIIIILALTACTHIPRYTDDQSKAFRTRYIKADFSTTYDTCLEIIHDEAFQIKLAERSSGVISATYNGPRQNLFRSYTGYTGNQHRTFESTLLINIIIKNEKNDSSFVNVLFKQSLSPLTNPHSAGIRGPYDKWSSRPRYNLYDLFYTKLNDALDKNALPSKNNTWYSRDENLTTKHTYTIRTKRQTYTGKIVINTDEYLYLLHGNIIYKINKNLIGSIADWENKDVTSELLNKKFAQKINFNNYTLESIE